MKKTIKFLTGNPYQYSVQDDNLIYINSTQHMLKTYHDHFGKSKDDYIWLNCRHDILSDLDEYVAEICQEDIDILGISTFIWNYSFYEAFIKKYKKLKPNTIIMMGGREILARSDPDWFKKNPEVTYVVYGDGEKAFSDLLDMLAGYEKDIKDIPNLIYQNEKGERVINKHEIMRDKNYWALSYITHCKDYLKKEVEDLVNKFKHIKTGFIWERNRGCPYVCSFCDWTDSLHNKVSRRTSNFKPEMDIISTFNNGNILFYTADANFGMFDEDLEIVKYINEKISKKYPKFIPQYTNWAKNNKDKVFRIWDYLMEHSSKSVIQKNFKISLQDINEQVLKNIDRPSIAWKDVKDYYISRRDKYSPVLELIVGLPGQTKQSWNETLLELIDVVPAHIICNSLLILPYAPAAKASYQEKYKIKVTPSIYQIAGHIEVTDKNRKDFINYVLESYQTTNFKFVKYDIATESYSFNLEDLIYFHLAVNYILNLLVKIRPILIQGMKVDYFIKFTREKFIKAIPMLEKLAKEQYDILKDDYDNYGILLFGSKHPKGYYCHYDTWFNEQLGDKQYTGVVTFDKLTC